MKLSTALGAVLALSPLSSALSLSGYGGRPYSIIHEADKRSGPLQDLVTWDEHSLFIRGERAMLFSGEVHPFRLPVPSLYMDLFDKIKALGFNMVSFYVDWALVEGKQGEFSAEGIFALEPFFDTAKKAGIYLLARPGPYINAEVSGGGFPGYLQKLKGILRSDAADFLSATDNYMARVCAIIAQAQITNGGPIVLFQPENEYTSAKNIPFPNGKYMQYVIDQARKAGIVLPMINNDAFPTGNYAPGTGVGEMDIYGHDNYPLGFDCSNPTVWPPGRLPTDLNELHQKQSPKTPYSIVEFQGGSFDPWGGPGFENCAALINHEFARVFYKNNFAAGITLFNVYMIWGGTNWGNIGHPGGYTSYDYGASIRENRVIDREKYSELKLQGQFMRVSPGYMTASVGNATNSEYSDNTGITITPLINANTKAGNYYVARQTDYSATGSVSYSLKLPTSEGTLTIPQMEGTLSLHGRDSKVHLTDYPLGKVYSLLYSTCEVLTWMEPGTGKTILILYGGPNELHEFAVTGFESGSVANIEGSDITSRMDGPYFLARWSTKPEKQAIEINDLIVYLLDRNAAYNYWVAPLPGPDNSPYGSSIMNPKTVIINGAYLIRSASISGSTLSICADFNVSTPLEVIGMPPQVTDLSINGKPVSFEVDPWLGSWLSRPEISLPNPQLPDLSKLNWHKADSLPETQKTYDDSRWPNATETGINATVSLYGSDYGFYTGTLLYRGRFKATGKESHLWVWTSGGSAYASSVWLNNRFLGSQKGWSSISAANSTYTVSNLAVGSDNIVTVVVDTMGLDQNWVAGEDGMKTRRGIFSYGLSNSQDGPATTEFTSWKVTGNLGGEDYADKFRGPLNEGGLFFERQGFHLPNPPVESDSAFTPGAPFDTTTPGGGITYYTAKLELDLPADTHDIPLSFVFEKGAPVGDYRAILYVNGFQYGKYASNIGPQTEFPVPEGILNYNGENWIGLAVWAVDASGARVPGFSLKAGTAVQTSRSKVEVVKGPSYEKRSDAY